MFHSALSSLSGSRRASAAVTEVTHVTEAINFDNYSHTTLPAPFHDSTVLLKLVVPITSGFRQGRCWVCVRQAPGNNPVRVQGYFAEGTDMAKHTKAEEARQGLIELCQRQGEGNRRRGNQQRFTDGRGAIRTDRGETAPCSQRCRGCRRCRVRAGPRRRLAG